MARPTRSLLSTITDRAAFSFGRPVTKENFSEWSAHWFATAEKWAAELAREGLVETARAIQDHINWQRKQTWG